MHYQKLTVVCVNIQVCMTISQIILTVSGKAYKRVKMSASVSIVDLYTVAQNHEPSQLRLMCLITRK